MSKEIISHSLRPALPMLDYQSLYTNSPQPVKRFENFRADPLDPRGRWYQLFSATPTYRRPPPPKPKASLTRQQQRFEAFAAERQAEHHERTFLSEWFRERDQEEEVIAQFFVTAYHDYCLWIRRHDNEDIEMKKQRAKDPFRNMDPDRYLPMLRDAKEAYEANMAVIKIEQKRLADKQKCMEFRSKVAEQSKLQKVRAASTAEIPTLDPYIDEIQDARTSATKAIKAQQQPAHGTSARGQKLSDTPSDEAIRAEFKAKALAGAKVHAPAKKSTPRVPCARSTRAATQPTERPILTNSAQPTMPTTNQISLPPLPSSLPYIDREGRPCALSPKHNRRYRRELRFTEYLLVKIKDGKPKGNSRPHCSTTQVDIEDAWVPGCPRCYERLSRGKAWLEARVAELKANCPSLLLVDYDEDKAVEWIKRGWAWMGEEEVAAARSLLKLSISKQKAEMESSKGRTSLRTSSSSSSSLSGHKSTPASSSAGASPERSARAVGEVTQRVTELDIDEA